eukprot:gene1313-585_t
MKFLLACCICASFVVFQTVEAVQLNAATRLNLSGNKRPRSDASSSGDDAIVMAIESGTPILKADNSWPRSERVPASLRNACKLIDPKLIFHSDDAEKADTENELMTVKDCLQKTLMDALFSEDEDAIPNVVELLMKWYGDFVAYKEHHSSTRKSDLFMSLLSSYTAVARLCLKPGQKPEYSVADRGTVLAMFQPDIRYGVFSLTGKRNRAAVRKVLKMQDEQYFNSRGKFAHGGTKTRVLYALFSPYEIYIGIATHTRKSFKQTPWTSPNRMKEAGNAGQTAPIGVEDTPGASARFGEHWKGIYEATRYTKTNMNKKEPTGKRPCIKYEMFSLRKKEDLKTITGLVVDTESVTDPDHRFWEADFAEFLWIGNVLPIGNDAGIPKQEKVQRKEWLTGRREVIVAEEKRIEAAAKAAKKKGGKGRGRGNGKGKPVQRKNGKGAGRAASSMSSIMMSAREEPEKEPPSKKAKHSMGRGKGRRSSGAVMSSSQMMSVRQKPEPFKVPEAAAGRIKKRVMSRRASTDEPMPDADEDDSDEDSEGEDLLANGRQSQKLGITRRVLHAWQRARDRAEDGGWFSKEAWKESAYGLAHRTADRFGLSPAKNPLAALQAMVISEPEPVPEEEVVVTCEVSGNGQLVVMEERDLDQIYHPSPVPENSMENTASIVLPCGKPYIFSYLLVDRLDRDGLTHLFTCSVTTHEGYRVMPDITKEAPKEGETQLLTDLHVWKELPCTPDKSLVPFNSLELDARFRYIGFRTDRLLSRSMF